MPASRSIGRTENAPFGKSVLSIILASSNTDKGVERAGLIIIGFPDAIAGAILCTAKFKGKLNGAIPAINPTGKYLTNPSFPSPAGVQSIEKYSLGNLLDSSAAIVNTCIARSISPKAYFNGLPASLHKIRAKSFFKILISSAICINISYFLYEGKSRI